jgi:hypothetical protein
MPRCAVQATINHLDAEEGGVSEERRASEKVQPTCRESGGIPVFAIRTFLSLSRAARGFRKSEEPTSSRGHQVRRAALLQVAETGSGKGKGPYSRRGWEGL